MLKKLRIRFIAINMSIVLVMLGIIFGLMYYTTSRSLERESIQMMENIAVNPQKAVPPDFEKDDIQLPYFCVLLGKDNEYEISGGYFDLSDKTLIEKLIACSNEKAMSTGVLTEYGFRYLRSETPIGRCLVFADLSSELATLRHLTENFLIIGGISLLAFFGISVLLSWWATRPVAQAWQQQKQFVADASHELKTPLTVIMTDAELLSDADCPEEDRLPLSSGVLSAAAQMRGLVESLLELARVDAGNLKQNRETLSFSETVSASAMAFETVFFEKGLLLRYEVSPDIFVKGIGAQLKQIVDILLDNAAKYASAGGETIVRLTRISSKSCLLEVSNQGEPLSEQELRDIFKRFYRADKARAMNHSYGLGLSIAKTVTEAHGGKIYAKSSNGYNRFYVELPAVKPKTGG